MAKVLICIAGLSLFSGTFAKPFDPLTVQYNKAMLLFESGEYYDAVTEFKRLIFFDKDKKFAFKANMMIGDCYKIGAKFSDAVLYYTYARIAAVSDSELFRADINIVRANILRRTTSRAIMLLNSYYSDPRFFKKSGEINYWKGWAYIFSDRWKKASEAFAKTDTNRDLAEFCDKVDNDMYSATLADILSHVIPGSGQFYTGHYLSGLLSLGWNVLWGYVTINAFAANRIFDGLMVGNFLWFRFYRGNYENAEQFAYEKNRTITNKALSYLQFKFKGLKP